MRSNKFEPEKKYFEIITRISTFVVWIERFKFFCGKKGRKEKCLFVKFDAREQLKNYKRVSL